MGVRKQRPRGGGLKDMGRNREHARSPGHQKSCCGGDREAT